jgi:hypothetical protein
MHRSHSRSAERADPAESKNPGRQLSSASVAQGIFINVAWSVCTPILSQLADLVEEGTYITPAV